MRASNNSATLGNPPVMSRDFPISLGILTSVCPLCTFCLSLTTKVALTGKMVPPARIFPLLLIISMWGLNLRSRASTITICFLPPSTASTANVSPSMKSFSETKPVSRANIISVYGSHFIKTVLPFIFSPSLTNIVDP